MEKSKEATITTVAKINKQNILLIENGEKRVAIKPICIALGVDPESQRKKILRDEILNSVTVLSTATGSDKKEYKMTTIPFKFVFGWLFSINPKNVAPEAKENIIRYKLECYNALYDHFTELDEYLKYRNKIAEKKWDEVELAREGFKFAKTKLESLKKEFAEARSMTIDDFRKIKSQLEINFNEKESEAEDV